MFVAQTVTIGEQARSVSEALKYSATHQIENPSNSTALVVISLYVKECVRRVRKT